MSATTLAIPRDSHVYSDKIDMSLVSGKVSTRQKNPINLEQNAYNEG